MNEIAPYSDSLKCMVKDKYGNKTYLGWNGYSLKVLGAVCPFRRDEYWLSTNIYTVSRRNLTSKIFSSMVLSDEKNEVLR